MTIIKKLILLLCTLLLISCQQIPSIESDEMIYTTFELGVNYTDHMLAIAKNDRAYLNKYHVQGDLSDLYETLYTHQEHYLLAQILYYLPMNMNLDSKDRWETYFDDWIKSLQEGQLDQVNKYYEDTILKDYIENSFEYDIAYLAEIIELVKPVYLEQFDYYKRNIWPSVSEELYKKCSYINESLISYDLENRWNAYYEGNMGMIFSLSNYNNEDLQALRIADSKTVMAIDGEDPVEFIEVLSQNYGMKLATKGEKDTVNDLRQAYYFLEDVIALDEVIYKQLEFAVSQMNNEVMGGETRYFMEQVRKGMYPIMTVTHRDFVYNVIEAALINQKVSHPLIIDGQLNYMNLIFDKMVINDDLSIYYKQSCPLIIEEGQELNLLEDTYASIPELSSDQKKIMFISPFEWEVIGNLYIYDLETKYLDIVLKADYSTQETIKQAIWYDQNTVYFIKGLAYGTVTRGGTVYKINLTSKVIEELPIELDDYSEVSHIEMDDHILKLTITVHNQDATDFTLEYREIDIEE